MRGLKEAKRLKELEADEKGFESKGGCGDPSLAFQVHLPGVYIH